jgi:PAS domain S-box-containing protein
MRIEPQAATEQQRQSDDDDVPGEPARRRLELLHRLTTALADARHVDDVCAHAVAALVPRAAGRSSFLPPFCLLYLLHPDGRLARLAGCAGLVAGDPAAPVLMDLDEPPAAWQHGPQRAVVMGLEAAARQPVGFLVAGLPLQGELDDDGRRFQELAAALVSAALLRVHHADAGPADDSAGWVRDTVQAVLDPLPTPPRAGSPPAADAPPRVLVVDDNPDMRIYLHRLLHPQYEVYSAADGREGLAAATRHEPELVISDTAMPGLDGFGMLRALRANAATASLPVILLSARSGDAARIEGLEAGADDYLAKPFSPRELLARVAGTIAIGRVRRRALQRERELRAETVSVLESMTDAFIAVDPSWRITYVNGRAEQVLGLPREQLVNRDHWSLFPEASGTPAERECRRAMVQRVAVQVEHDWARAGRWLEISAFPIRRGGLALFGRDITARKQAESALLRADRRKDEFLATLAHELRNPLAPIRSALQLLRRTGGATTEAEPLHAMMERQVDHIVRLVDDLLEVARITEGKIELRRTPVDLADVIARAVETSRTLIDAAGHELVLQLPAAPLPIYGDTVRLAQVFGNLLNNAAKYTDAGGRIDVAARLHGDRVVASVRDNGVGIRPEMLPHVFELFTQVDDAGRHAQGGLGIGLTLVRSLVEMHGGSIEARSEGPGTGCEFVVALPCLAAGAAADVPAREPAPPAPAKRPPQRVLVVDDNPDAADAVGLVLQYLGVESKVVNDGSAALAVFDTFRPDLVLLDLGMPGLDGYDVARWMRERPGHGPVRIVALTGWGDASERARTLKAGFDGHLVKPVDIDALQALLA